MPGVMGSFADMNMSPGQALMHQAEELTVHMHPAEAVLTVTALVSLGRYQGEWLVGMTYQLHASLVCLLPNVGCQADLLLMASCEHPWGLLVIIVVCYVTAAQCKWLSVV